MTVITDCHFFHSGGSHSIRLEIGVIITYLSVTSFIGDLNVSYRM